MSRIEEIIRAARDIPPFPKIANQVLRKLEDPAVNATDLATLIKYDSAITANVLKTCNAAYFGLTRKVSSLEDALLIVGHDTLKDIMVTSCSAQFYKGTAGEGYQLADGELWRHSVATAIMARQLAAKHIPGLDPGMAFTVGLLHDIGKSFISRFVAEEFDRILDLAHGTAGTFIAAEQQVLGLNHAELGGMILQNWEFPSEMVEAVRSHHNEDALNRGPLAAAIALCNTLVISAGIGVGADGLCGRVQGEGLGRYGITPLDLDRLMAAVIFEMEKAEEMLNLSR